MEETKLQHCSRFITNKCFPSLKLSVCWFMNSSVFYAPWLPVPLPLLPLISKANSAHDHNSSSYSLQSSLWSDSFQARENLLTAVHEAITSGLRSQFWHSMISLQHGLQNLRNGLRIRPILSLHLCLPIPSALEWWRHCLLLWIPICSLLVFISARTLCFFSWWWIWWICRKLSL